MKRQTKFARIEFVRMLLGVDFCRKVNFLLVISYQVLVTSYQLIFYQLLVTFHQLLVIFYQLLVIVYEVLFISCQLLLLVTMCVCVCVCVFTLPPTGFFRLHDVCNIREMFRSTIFCCEYQLGDFCQVPSSPYLKMSNFTSKDENSSRQLTGEKII